MILYKLRKSLNLSIGTLLRNRVLSKGYICRNCSGSVLKNECSNNNINNSLKIVSNNINNIKYGQPTYLSHPHLLKSGDLIQGISLAEICSRRLKLLENIQSYAYHVDRNLLNHIVIIPSSVKKYMSDKIPYVFRQNSDFLYLTGCQEPDSILIMTIDVSRNCKSILFVRPKDENAELWDGSRTGVDNAIDFFGVDESYSINDFQKFLNKYIQFQKQPFILWYNGKTSDQSHLNESINVCLNQNDIKINTQTIQSPTVFIHQQRVIKSVAEQQLMQKTCEIASKSINQTIRETKPGDSEHHIYARVDYHCRMNNASFLAYPPVVASGRNATTIHYINNSQIVHDGDLVLLDAGCEYGGYTSDITRTWPINGKFTSAQQILYEVLQRVQQELIETLLHKGGDTLDNLFDVMCMILGKYLQEIGLISKDVSDRNLAQEAYYFCPHHVSHYLGMDVHDTPLISRNTKILPGMVFTVEPGIYVRDNCKNLIAKEFCNIGMRIEDDVMVTENNTVKVLTESCIKDLGKLKKHILNSV